MRSNSVGIGMKSPRDGLGGRLEASIACSRIIGSCKPRTVALDDVLDSKQAQNDLQKYDNADSIRFVAPGFGSCAWQFLGWGRRESFHSGEV